MSDALLQLNDDNFSAEVLESKTPVLVDFWAPWCGPCRTIAPALEQLAGEYAGRLRIAKYNVEECTKYAVAHGIQSIPALLFFSGGKVVDTIVGAYPKSHIAEKIDRVVG